VSAVVNEAGPINAFTVDLEDWFQGLTSTNPHIERWPLLESRVVPATERLLSLLDAHHVRATFFVLGYVAERHPRLIERVREHGHELAVHGYAHRSVTRLRPDEFASEIDRASEALERITGEPPAGHRAPYFSINSDMAWAFDLLARRGYRYDSSVFPMRSLLYGDARAPIVPHRVGHDATLIEFPISALEIGRRRLPFSGGFYLRALPYRAVRWAMRHVNRKGLAAILYVHPWELDTGQCYPHVTPRERVSHYYGRGGLEAKLERLFTDFRFTTLADLAERLGPANDKSPQGSS